MITERHADTASLLPDLRSWFGSVSPDPTIRVEEWVEDGRRVIRADIPGVDPQRDIELSVEGGMLHLRGERRTESHHRHRTEMRYGTFSRLLSLPPGTRPEDISATYTDGVLTVSMPEGGASESRTIPIRASGEDDGAGDSGGG